MLIALKTMRSGKQSMNNKLSAKQDVILGLVPVRLL